MAGHVLSEDGSIEKSLPSQKSSLIYFLSTLIFLIIIAIVICAGLIEAWKSTFINEYIKGGLIIIALFSETSILHYMLSIINKFSEFGIRAYETHSFTIHSCNADPEHCFKINGKPLPVCARHLGYYSTLTLSLLLALLTPPFWITITKLFSPNIHLGIAVICILYNIVEGGLGKAGILTHHSNIFRLIGGFLTALAWDFIIMSFLLMLGVV